MEREILFRGKRVDNGEWVEGSYIKTFHNSFIVPQNDETVRAMDIIPVYCKTIGQFTGLTDKNGVKIFEGNIFIYHNTHYLVRYSKIYLSFCAVKITELKNPSRKFIDNPIYGDLHEEYRDTIEIIGNIYDNPELLK